MSKVKPTTVKVTLETHSRLTERLKKSPNGWHYNDVIKQLLDIAEMEAALQLPQEATSQ